MTWKELRDFIETVPEKQLSESMVVYHRDTDRIFFGDEFKRVVGGIDPGRPLESDDFYIEIR